MILLSSSPWYIFLLIDVYMGISYLPNARIYRSTFWEYTVPPSSIIIMELCMHNLGLPAYSLQGQVREFVKDKPKEISMMELAREPSKEYQNVEHICWWPMFKALREGTVESFVPLPHLRLIKQHLPNYININ